MKSILYLVLACVFCFVIWSTPYFLGYPGKNDGAESLGALFTGLGFAGLLVTIFQQQREIQKTETQRSTDVKTQMLVNRISALSSQLSSLAQVAEQTKWRLKQVEREPNQQIQSLDDEARSILDEMKDAIGASDRWPEQDRKHFLDLNFFYFEKRNKAAMQSVGRQAARTRLINLLNEIEALISHHTSELASLVDRTKFIDNAQGDHEKISDILTQLFEPEPGHD